MSTHIFILMRRALAAAFIVIPALWAAPASAQAVRNIYTVSGVPIDATASSSTIAKSQALASGRQVAFTRLVARLTLPEDLQARGGAPLIGPEVLDRLIASYSVSDEKSSSVRYLARLSVDFDPSAVRDWLKNLGVTMVDSRALPLAVFPFFPNAAEPDRAAWSQAWRSGGLESELVPLGLSTVASAQNEFAAYEAAAKAAGAGGALLATVQTSLAAGRLSAVVKVTKLEGGARFELGEAQASVIAPSSDSARAASIQALMDRAVVAASDLVQLEWKRRSVVRGGQVARSAVTAAYSSLEEWNAIRSSLAKSTLIRDIRVEAIAKDGALLTLGYTGTEEQLRTDLAQSRLSLNSTDKGLVIRSQQ